MWYAVIILPFMYKFLGFFSRVNIYFFLLLYFLYIYYQIFIKLSTKPYNFWFLPLKTFLLENALSSSFSVYFFLLVLFHSGNYEVSLPYEFSLLLPCFLNLMTLFLIGRPLTLCTWLSERNRRQIFLLYSLILLNVTLYNVLFIWKY